eukprot:gene7590-745_t
MHASLSTSRGLGYARGRCMVARKLRMPTVMRAAAEAESSEEAAPIGCSRYTDLKTNIITVVDIISKGSAEKEGQISLGDQLIAVSGVTYAGEMEYNESCTETAILRLIPISPSLESELMVKTGLTVVRMKVANEKMKTVRAAIGSHPGHIAVTLEFQRCAKNIEA